jgi:hypothetical protein
MLFVLIVLFFVTVVALTLIGAAIETAVDPYAEGAGFGGALFGCFLGSFVWLAFLFPWFLGN